MIVDSHNHLWHIGTSDLYWLSPDMRDAGGPIVRDFLVQDLKAAFATVGVHRSVLVHAWHAKEDNLQWLEVAEANEVIGAVVTWLDLTNPSVGETLDRFARYSKFRGVRACGQDEVDDSWLTRPAVRRGIREVAARGDLSLDLLLNIPQLREVPRIADENPDLPLVLNHLAKPQTSEPGYFEPWATLMRPLADVSRLEFKISGMLTEAGQHPTSELLRPAIQLMVETFGFDRLMWGSDWPVCLLAGSYKINFDTTLGGFGRLSPSERRRLLGDNARKFYRIG